VSTSGNVAVYNFEFMAGTDVSNVFTITDSLGAPRDLTDYTAYAQMRTPGVSSVLSATFTCSIPDPLAGAIQVVLLGVDSAVAVGTYVYDVLMVHSGNPAPEPVVKGSVKVTRAVTVVA
jgi:hypothetical protein